MKATNPNLCFTRSKQNTTYLQGLPQLQSLRPLIQTFLPRSLGFIPPLVTRVDKGRLPVSGLVSHATTRVGTQLSSESELNTLQNSLLFRTHLLLRSMHLSYVITYTRGYMGFLSGKQLNYDLTTKSLITLHTYTVPAKLSVHQSIMPHETNTGRNWFFYAREAGSRTLF